MYRFIQWEFPWLLGPGDGRYVLRDHAGGHPHHVLVLATEAAPVRRGSGWRGRGPRDADPQPGPAETAVTRATLIDALEVDEDEAGAWLAAVEGASAPDALAQLNRAVRAHRVAAADPFARDLRTEDALVVRAGFGEGEQVADGRWSKARELPHDAQAGPRRARREAALRPQERLAALLGARDAVLACEELTLRARQDLDAGRDREAALQAHVALEAAVAELPAFATIAEVASRIEGLRGSRGALAAAANEALQGGPRPDTMAAVAAAVDRIEAALRARSARSQW